MKIIEHSLKIRSQGKTLQGRLHLPDIENPPLVVGSHGLEGTMESAKQVHLANLLPRSGIAFARFDHRGCGHSQGSFLEDTSLEKRAADLIAVTLHVLGLNLTRSDFALFGSSLGGAASILAWNRLEAGGRQPAGLVVCAAPLKSRTIDNIPLEGNDSRPALPLSFFKDNLLFDLKDQCSGLHHVLVFHGDRDEIVPVENGRMLHDSAGSPKNLVILPEGDHRMSDPGHQELFAEMVPAWYRTCFSHPMPTPA